MILLFLIIWQLIWTSFLCPDWLIASPYNTIPTTFSNFYRKTSIFKFSLFWHQTLSKFNKIFILFCSRMLSYQTNDLQTLEQCTKQCVGLASNKSASIKTKDVPIKSSKLLCFNLILFYSKYCKLKTFPTIISRVFIFVMNGPRQKALDVKLSHCD